MNIGGGIISKPNNPLFDLLLKPGDLKIPDKNITPLEVGCSFIENYVLNAVLEDENHKVVWESLNTEKKIYQFDMTGDRSTLRMMMCNSGNYGMATNTRSFVMVTLSPKYHTFDEITKFLYEISYYRFQQQLNTPTDWKYSAGNTSIYDLGFKDNRRTYLTSLTDLEFVQYNIRQFIKSYPEICEKAKIFKPKDFIARIIQNNMNVIYGLYYYFDTDKTNQYNTIMDIGYYIGPIRNIYDEILIHRYNNNDINNAIINGSPHFPEHKFETIEYLGKTFYFEVISCTIYDAV